MRKYVSLFIVILILSVSACLTSDSSGHRVIKVIDGDTIIVSSVGKVRLIGIDTPEIAGPYTKNEYYGKKASKFTKKMLKGKNVRLEYDDINSAINHKDKYGRLLAYVYIMNGDNEILLQEEILKNGCGEVFRKFDFKYKDQFLLLENQAKIKKRGLWGNKN